MEEINKNNLPKHIAITMDGNGRWAKSKGKLRLFGHKNGVKSVRDTVEAAAEIGVEFLTLYAFSTENWNRPSKEVNALMTLLVSAINKETKTLMENNIKLSTIGDTDSLPSKAKKELAEAIDKTKENTRMTLVLALSYSGRWDILNAVNEIAKKGVGNDKITEEQFQQYLSTKSVPDPELLIRTSGEFRLSNFLLWQSAYTELYMTDKFWPDFREDELLHSILDYQTRQRRFGQTGEQVSE